MLFSKFKLATLWKIHAAIFMLQCTKFAGILTHILWKSKSTSLFLLKPKIYFKSGVKVRDTTVVEKSIIIYNTFIEKLKMIYYLKNSYICCVLIGNCVDLEEHENDVKV